MFGNSYFNSKQFSPKIRMKYFFFQKILRINGSVPWMVHFTSKIKSHQNIKNGNRNPGMSISCYIDGRNGIVFGENVWIGPGVKIISMNHNSKKLNEYIESKEIQIGDNCWLGAGSIILPEVSLANNIVVGAGAVVTKSFNQSNIVIAGNPAKIIKVI